MSCLHLLFADGELRTWLDERLHRAEKDVSAIPADQVLSMSEHDLLEHLTRRYCVNPPVLDLDRWYTTGAKDVQIDVSGDFGRAIRNPSCYVPGTRLEIRIPFAGDAELFRFRPSAWTTVLPRGRIEGRELVFWHEAPADTLDLRQFDHEINRNIDLIQRYLQGVKKDCDGFNLDLEQRLRQAIRQRRQKVLQDQQLEAYLKIPVRRKPDPSLVFNVPLHSRQRPQPTSRLRATGATRFVPEPAISEEDYAEILGVIGSWRNLVERLPRTFSEMPETVLRDILLVVLNNQFGPVGAEVFSRNGKTDVFLWHQKGAVFIAECKIWKGAKAFRAALDQLLGYLVWRDTKSALIALVRNSDVTSIQERAEHVIAAHPNYKRRAADLAGFPVYVLHHESDRAREIYLALILVAVPSQSSALVHQEDGDSGAA